MKQKFYLTIAIAISLIALSVYYIGRIAEYNKPPRDSEIKFYNPHSQAKEFIGYHNSIALTPEQEQIKSEALSAISAPCCSNNPISTCCCPCNLAKSVWGLSDFLITKHNYSVNQVKEAVSEWIRFTNKDGYTGNACYKRKCNLPFSENGCGGMDETRIF
jgi:hypothetical protein